MSRQLSAWSSRRLSSTSSVTRSPHRTHGTGPNNVPASDRNVPAWMSATAVPPPSSRAQWTASFIAIALLRRGFAGGSASIEIAVEGGCGRLRLTLVLRTELRRAVGSFDRTRHLEEADLADPHPEIQRDREVRHVRQLERQVPLPARIDVARRRVDEEAESPKTRLALEPCDEIVRELDPLVRLAEDELARVKDKRLVLLDRQQLGQIRLRRADVDERIPVVAEDPEALVEVEVDRRRLEVLRVVRVDGDAAGLDGRAYIAVRQDAHERRAVAFGRMSSGIVSPRSANRVSTSRLSASRSSKLWQTLANR